MQSYDITSPDISVNMGFAYVLIAQNMVNLKNYSRAKYYTSCAGNIHNEVFPVSESLLRDVYNRYI